MNASPPSDPWRATDVLALLARLFLGGFLIYMGVNKAVDPADFLKMVREYHVLNQYLLLNLVAATLPWFEVFCGTLLVFGVATRGAALNLAILLAAFTVLIFLRGWSLSQSGGQPLCAIRFNCGCGTGEVLVCHKLIENTILVAIATWLTLRRKSRLALRHSLAGSL